MCLVSDRTACCRHDCCDDPHRSNIGKKTSIAIAPLSEVIDDWKVVSVNFALTALLAPLTAVCSGIILSTLGQGWIHLPTHSYWYLVSLIFLVVFADLYNYTFHRLQHAIPFLWAMHSFHHSANALTFVTGARHLWMERVLASAVLPIMPLLFQIPPDMQLILSLIYFIPDSCAHLNVRFPMGRMITFVNSPQWHRIHHSAMPEHRDKNFASLLPLWDILFGTAWIPKPDEYPVTGFDPPVSVSVIDSVIWPFRRAVRGLLVRFFGPGGYPPLAPSPESQRSQPKGSVRL